MLVAGGGPRRPVGGPADLPFCFLSLEVLYADSYLSSLDPCVMGPRPGSRQRALYLPARQWRVHCVEGFLSAQALPSGIKPVPRASHSRQRL
jgi:hypothetical protein